MEDLDEGPATKSWVPWWIDPYSDNPIAFGILFALLIIGIIGGMLLFRYLFISNPGAHPIGPEGLLHLHLGRAWHELLRLFR